MPPKVSIIIPTYNRIDSLLGTIRSIDGQCCTDYEVIIVDDCSDDGTAQAFRGMENIRVIANENRRGPSFSRNRGISESRGEYVWFLDSDVVLPDPHVMDRMINAFEVYEGIGSLGGEIAAYETDNNKAYGRKIQWDARNREIVALRDDKMLVSCDYLATCNCFTKRSHAMRLDGFDEMFVFGAEDMDFGYRLKKSGLKNYVCYDLAVLHFHDLRGRYSDETDRYQRTRIMFARKHYDNTKILLMFLCDLLKFLKFYLIIIPKLLFMKLSAQTITAQNLTGGWRMMVNYFAVSNPSR